MGGAGGLNGEHSGDGIGRGGDRVHFSPYDGVNVDLDRESAAPA